jgi:hypothetical protein
MRVEIIKQILISAIWDPSVINTDDLFRLLYLVHLAALNEPATQVHNNYCNFTKSSSTTFALTIQALRVAYI